MSRVIHGVLSVEERGPVEQPPIADASRRKAQQVALKMFAAQRLGLAAETKRLSRQLARLGVYRVETKPKE